MNIEVKLKDSKYCDGCSMLQLVTDWDFCSWYKEDTIWTAWSSSRGCYHPRLAKCIAENGE